MAEKRAAIWARVSTAAQNTVKVKFICTAGRQPESERHKPRLLGEAIATADGSVTFVSRGPSLTRDGRGRPRRSNTFAKADGTGRDYAVWRLMCPSCPLHVEWRRERAEMIVRGLAERGVTTFDLSLS
jgi:hypothetical protein